LSTNSLHISFGYNTRNELCKLRDIYESGELHAILQSGLITDYVLKKCNVESLFISEM